MDSCTAQIGQKCSLAAKPVPPPFHILLASYKEDFIYLPRGIYCTFRSIPDGRGVQGRKHPPAKRNCFSILSQKTTLRHYVILTFLKNFPRTLIFIFSPPAISPSPTTIVFCMLYTPVFNKKKDNFDPDPHFQKNRIPALGLLHVTPSCTNYPSNYVSKFQQH